MLELDCEESWALRNWCFWIVVLEKTLESPLDCKEIQPVHPKANQSWIFSGRTDAKAETPVLWPPHVKSWLIGKDPDAGRDWKQEEKGMTEDKMAGWHHRLDALEFGWTLGVDDGQGGLVCCDSWGHKESDTTERLNWTELNCSWDSQGKNIEVVCNSLLQWTTFCQNSPPWPIRLRWPYMVWLIVSPSYSSLWSMGSVWLVFCDCGFQCVCPLMDKDKRLMEASWGRDKLRGKLGLILMGGAVFSKPLIQFCWWVGLCSLPVTSPEAKLWWR